MKNYVVLPNHRCVTVAFTFSSGNSSRFLCYHNRSTRNDIHKLFLSFCAISRVYANNQLKQVVMFLCLRIVSFENACQPIKCTHEGEDDPKHCFVFFHMRNYEWQIFQWIWLYLSTITNIYAHEAVLISKKYKSLTLFLCQLLFTTFPLFYEDVN